MVFPWVESEIEALRERRSVNRLAIDIALWQFLHLLIWLRLVLLQDAAVLYMQNPGCSVFKYAPFNTDAFQSFVASSVSQIEQAQEEARLTLQNLPENVACSIRGAVAGFSLEQKCEREANKAYQDQLLAQLQYLTQLSASGCRLSRRQPAIETLDLTKLCSLSSAPFSATHCSSSLFSHVLFLSHPGCKNPELVPLHTSPPHTTSFSITPVLYPRSHTARHQSELPTSKHWIIIYPGITLVLPTSCCHAASLSCPSYIKPCYEP